ncbi:sushi domain-containing protein 4-like [Zootoca vivipara]|uniref:sushi domain-containing protein 4-like n=1 Tax=Zootoca vivipara TaxID=8524 RepID=UPI00293BA45F|nr:sushi domain-containing protein 4-like [Zootoca vivipara]
MAPPTQGGSPPYLNPPPARTRLLDTFFEEIREPALEGPWVTFDLPPAGVAPPLPELMLKMSCSHGRTTRSLFVCLALVTLGDTRLSSRRKGCVPPDPPAHSTYRCQAPLCQEPPPDSILFKPETVLEFYCQPGYVATITPALAICQGGQWNMLTDFACMPQGTPRPDAFLSAASVPVVLAAAVVFSAILVTVVACVLLKTRLHVCRCLSSYEHLDDQWEQIEEPDVPGLDCSGGPLPSYEEAVSGPTGSPRLSQEAWARPDLCGLGEEPPSYQDSLGAASAESGSPPARESPSQLPAPLLPPGVGKKDGP